MFQRDGRERLDSLQHYSQTLPELQNSLKSEEDLASDGAFLTHFLMLVYEVCMFIPEILITKFFADCDG